MKQSILIVVMSLIFLSGALAQTGSIRVHVYDDGGEPIPYANVLVKGPTIGNNTDENGLSVLTSIPVGTQEVEISFIGYETKTIQVDVQKNKVNYYRTELDESGISIGGVEISASRQEDRTKVKISKIQVSKRQIEALPSTGADADLVQYLQVLPGVISTGDQGGQLFIRGGSPVQNKIQLDGLTIYNPFHSIGFYSTFETELIKNVDVLTGAFNAEHGGRISAVVDITSRDGNIKQFGGQLSASPFMLRGVVEGPLFKSEGGSVGTVMLSAKKSIIDQTSLDLYSHASVNDSIGLPFDFTDLYGKFTFLTPSGSKFNFFGFNFDDNYNNPLIADIDWNNSGGGFTFNILPQNSALTFDGIVGYTSYETGIKGLSDMARSSAIREYLLGLNFNYFGDNFEFKYGTEIKSIRTEFNFFNPFQIEINEIQNTSEISAFGNYTRTFNKLVLEAGLRLQFYPSLSETSLEPRAGLKYNITDKTRFKAAAGIYSQNLISTSNERDVVNLFTGFLSGPEERFFDIDGEPVSTKLQRAKHLVVGVEQDIGSRFQANVEGYLKDFDQIIIVNRNKTDINDPNFATEEGDAYGVDFTLKYTGSRSYFWATYSHGYVNRNDGEQEYPTIFDRRNNINLLGTYTLGADNEWLLSARWNFGSGFPFTQTQGFYNSLSFLGDVDTDYVTENPDEVGIIYSDSRNGGRLPSYHRLDLSAMRRIDISDRINMEITASVSNVYDRDNIFYFDRVLFERVDQLPIIPALGLKLNFE